MPSQLPEIYDAKRWWRTLTASSSTRSPANLQARNDERGMASLERQLYLS